MYITGIMTLNMIHCLPVTALLHIQLRMLSVHAVTWIVLVEHIPSQLCPIDFMEELTWRYVSAYVIKLMLLCYVCDWILTNWDTVIPIKLEQIMLFKLPVMLLSISEKSSLLCWILWSVRLWKLCTKFNSLFYFKFLSKSLHCAQFYSFMLLLLSL